MNAAERFYPPLDNETVLSNILHNTRMLLRKPDVAHQLAALMSPREGYPETDAIPFTEQSCTAVHQYLREHGILCLRVRTYSSRQNMYSILTASSPSALARLLETARRQTRRDAISHPGLKFDALDSVEGLAPV